jgi:hypothetical protein
MYMYINKSIKSWRRGNHFCRFSKKLYLHLRVDMSARWHQVISTSPTLNRLINVHVHYTRLWFSFLFSIKEEVQKHLVTTSYTMVINSGLFIGRWLCEFYPYLYIKFFFELLFFPHKKNTKNNHQSTFTKL